MNYSIQNTNRFVPFDDKDPTDFVEQETRFKIKPSQTIIQQLDQLERERNQYHHIKKEDSKHDNHLYELFSQDYNYKKEINDSRNSTINQI